MVGYQTISRKSSNTVMRYNCPIIKSTVFNLQNRFKGSSGGPVRMGGHRRRNQFLLKAYPNAPTHQPTEELPRRGSRGAWMSNPSNIHDLGQLDGTNIAHEEWYREREYKVEAMLEKIPVT